MPLSPTKKIIRQANLDLGVRFGHSEEIGSRRAMEDRTTMVGDIFRLEVPQSFRNRSGVGVLAEAPSTPPTGIIGGASGDTDRRKMSLSALGGPAPTAAGTPGTACGGSGSTFEANDDAECASDACNKMPTMETGGGSDDARAGAARATDVAPIAIFAGRTRTTSPSGLSGTCELLEVEAEATDAVEQREGAKVDALAEHTSSPRDAIQTSDSNEEQKTRGVPPAAAFFAVYDGHDGDAVAEALQERLHKLVAKQVRTCHRGVARWWSKPPSIPYTYRQISAR